MCVIIVAPKGVEKNSEFLYKSIKNSEKNNTDGMGFTFKKHNSKKIYISKGYKSVQSIIDGIESHNLSLNDELLIHTRNGNVGSINTDMCHPFVVNKKDILKNDCFVKSPTLVHNGTFSKYYNSTGNFSDTYNFVYDFLSKEHVLSFLKESKEDFKDYFKDHIGTSRVALLFPDKDLITIGDFIEDNGYLFSNVGYKNTNYSNRGGYEQYNDYSGCSYYNSTSTVKLPSIPTIPFDAKPF